MSESAISAAGTEFVFLVNNERGEVEFLEPGTIKAIVDAIIRNEAWRIHMRERGEQKRYARRIRRAA